MTPVPSFTARTVHLPGAHLPPAGRFSTARDAQWFGDLVTMRWFDDPGSRRDSPPSWRPGARRLDPRRAPGRPSPRQQARRYAVDQPTVPPRSGRAGTIWSRLRATTARSLQQGALGLKQLEYLVATRPASSFLAAHYANATWRDLLGAVGRAATGSRASGAPHAATGDAGGGATVVVRGGRSRLALAQRRPAALRPQPVDGA
jgi:hypothetical protein